MSVYIKLTILNKFFHWCNMNVRNENSEIRDFVLETARSVVVQVFPVVMGRLSEV